MKKIKLLLLISTIFSLCFSISCKKEVEEPAVANYIIHHYLQNLDNDEYTMFEDDDDVIEGIYEEMAVSFFAEYEGFNFKQFTMQKFKNGETVEVNVYYDRKIITLTFDLNGGTTETDLADGQLKGKYDDFIVIETPERTGYEFDGWSEIVPATFPANDMVFKAKWNPNANSEYRVEHYQQNIKDDEYTIVEADTEIFQGITDTQTKAQANDYKGFKAKEFLQQKIEGDNSTVIKIYYDRYVSILTFELGNGKTNKKLEGGSLKGRYGDKVEIEDPVITGYEFIGWSYEVPETFPDYNFTYEALYSAYPRTEYKVEHYLQDIYDDYYSLQETETLYGVTDSYTNAISRDYTGFTVKEFEQQIISPDNSTVLKIYYDRNISVFTFELNGGKTISTLYNDSLSGRYGSVLEIEDPVKTGYVFKSWSQKLPEEFPDYNARIEACWEPAVDTEYKVEHYQQNLMNDEFTLFETEHKTGITDTNTFASAKNYKNFIAQEFSQRNINGDNSTVIKIYYDRIISTMSFNLDGGICKSLNGYTEITGKAGASVSVTNPVKENYTFIEWSPEIPEKIPDHDVTYTAIWQYMPILVYIVSEDFNVDCRTNQNIVTFTADDSYTDFTWTLEGVELNEEKGNIIQFDTADWCKGVYNITCSAEKKGIKYYSNVQIKKEDN